MNTPQGYTVIPAPREGVNDDVIRVVEWIVADGARVDEGDPVATLETTKATFDLLATRRGYLHRLVDAGAEMKVGSALALVSEGPERPNHQEEVSRASHEYSSAGQLITKRARELIEQHGLSTGEFIGLSVVRSQDVEDFLRSRQEGRLLEDVRRFRGEVLDPDMDWDRLIENEELYAEFKTLLVSLRKRMKAKYNRHVSLGTLLYDRWELARDYGFGEGTSVYDECLILGDVTVGKQCWIGPYTILDGGHSPLTIGDYVDIGSGTHVYTHNTIERALSGHRSPLFTRATKIGNCCFIAPKVMIAPGTIIGDHCFVAAGSYVEGVFPAYSYIAGNPARRSGTVEIQGERVRIHVDQKKPGFDNSPQVNASR